MRPTWSWLLAMIVVAVLVVVTYPYWHPKQCLPGFHGVGCLK